MNYAILVFLAVGGFFLYKVSSYFKAEEMLTILKVSRELDLQYNAVVRYCVNSSETVKEAVDKLQREVEGTVLNVGGRDYHNDVKFEWGDR